MSNIWSKNIGQYRDRVLDALCEGLRIESHVTMGEIIDSAVLNCDAAELAFLLPVSRRLLEQYNIAAPIDEFVVTLREFVISYANELQLVFHRAPDPEAEALVSLCVWFVITHKDLVRSIDIERVFRDGAWC